MRSGKNFLKSYLWGTISFLSESPDFDVNIKFAVSLHKYFRLDFNFFWHMWFNFEMVSPFKICQTRFQILNTICNNNENSIYVVDYLFAISFEPWIVWFLSAAIASLVWPEVSIQCETYIVLGQGFSPLHS